jgi:hypothetical protein
MKTWGKISKTSNVAINEIATWPMQRATVTLSKEILATKTIIRLRIAKVCKGKIQNFTFYNC